MGWKIGLLLVKLSPQRMHGFTGVFGVREIETTKVVVMVCHFDHYHF